jgi:hypothetical protein
LSFKDIEKEDFISALIAIYELQDVRPLVDLYLFSYLRTCAMYDSTVKAIGFDEVRVRYRQERRALLRELILSNLGGARMKMYIDSYIDRMIPVKDQDAFLTDTMEDLSEMDQNRIVGLGITVKELDDWMKRKHSLI